MTTVEVRDRSGCTMKLMELDGKLFPMFPVENLKNYRSVSLRHDDVILCAYPKSGTHWVWEVAMMLLSGKAETIPFKKSLQMLEFASAQDLAQMPSPRVLNTHVLYDDLPSDAFTLKTKLVFVARNPKDVAVSLYHHHVGLKKYYHYSGTFHDWLALFLDGKVDFGSWFDYTASWEKTIGSDVTNPIHVVMYEDMKKDPVGQTNRLAEFLGVNPSRDVVEAIATKCSFSNMSVDKKPCQDNADVIYRKGQVGDWKNTFTVADSEALDTALQQRRPHPRLHFTYTL